MKHLIEFRVDGTVTLETGKGVTTCVQIRNGVQCPATVRCYVVTTNGEDYTDVADIELKEGVLRALPCRGFMFIDDLG